MRDTLCSKGGVEVGSYGIHRSYYIMHHPEAASLRERWNGLLNVQLKHCLDTILHEDGVTLSRLRYIHRIKGLEVALCAQWEECMGLGTKRWKQE